MSKIDFGNHLFDDIQQILFRPLSHLTGCEARRRVGQEQAAEPFRYLALGDQRIHAIRHIDHLLETVGPNFQMLHGPIITVRLGALAQLN